MRFEVRFTTFHVNDRVGSKRWYTIWASVSIKFASVHIRRCGTRLTSSPPIQQARTTPGFCTFVSCLYANIAKIAKLLANPVPPHFDTVARLTHKKCDERKYDIEDAALSYLIRHVFIVYSLKMRFGLESVLRSCVKGSFRTFALQFSIQCIV